jgi:hypothetical protein
MTLLSGFSVASVMVDLLSLTWLCLATSSSARFGGRQPYLICAKDSLGHPVEAVGAPAEFPRADIDKLKGELSGPNNSRSISAIWRAVWLPK